MSKLPNTNMTPYEHIHIIMTRQLRF